MSEFIKRLKELENIKDNLIRERGMTFYVINYLRENKCCIPTEDWMAIVNHDYDPWCLIDEVTEHWTDHEKRDVMFTWSGEFEKIKLNEIDEITEPFMFWPEGTHGIDILDAMEEFFGINEEEEDNEVTKEVSYVFENGEQADVYRHDSNDYSVYFHNGDCSVRGSLWEIMDEVKECEAKSRVTKKKSEEDYEHTAMTSCGTYMNLWTTGSDYDCYVKFHEAEDKEKVDAATFATEDVCHHIMQNEYLETKKKKELIENLLGTYTDYGVGVIIIEKGSDN